MDEKKEQESYRIRAERAEQALARESEARIALETIARYAIESLQKIESPATREMALDLEAKLATVIV